MPGTDDRVLSCIQPTGGMHIGNYFGAVANWVTLQEQYECYFGIVDLHAMTLPYNPSELQAATEGMALDLLACGIDPQRSVLFVQSLVPEHTELCWILGCLCPVGDLNRMTQFKEKAELLERGEGFISAGLFTYPVLQAADILIYRAGKVPVGRDQEQHLELTREIARRFNGTFGEFFPEPTPLLTASPKLMSPADPNRKMSKSLGAKHYIGLFEEPDSITRKIKTAVTDSGIPSPEGEMGPGVGNLFEMLKICGREDTVNDFQAAYRVGELRYVDLKEAVIEALLELTGELRRRRAEIAADMARVRRLITESSARAREVARGTIREVRALTGLPARD